MYFGNRTRMTEVNCPAINIIRNREKWTTSGGYLNGGGYSRGSSYGHMNYTIAWNLMSPDDTRKILDYYSGVYGQDVIYFLDPFALKSNVLPLSWSVPRLAAEDAPSLLRGVTPTVTPLADVSNARGYPNASAVYETSVTAVSEELYIPVPPGENFYMLVTGSVSGSGGIYVTPNRGTPTWASLQPPSETAPYFERFADPGGVTIKLVYYPGSLVTLNSMTGLIGKTTPALSTFRSGEGHSGVRFEGTPQRTGYSSAIGEGLESVTASFKEVGAWE